MPSTTSIDDCAISLHPPPLSPRSRPAAGSGVGTGSLKSVPANVRRPRAITKGHFSKRALANMRGLAGCQKLAPPWTHISLLQTANKSF
ncbi:hypothetical protein PoB_001882900 [Plakobranchus ocellatus]|uniref:Uncharacterized protein n=1 Tax=Plakobranchus ocellatus TaxID=259542 RepID=A0AAV3ZAF9_9GAST|nr:hypothetical protein PoB_001882900 [Plakobranchus ocellatus]